MNSKVQITTSTYQDMLGTVGSKPAEAGGLLFGDPNDYVISRFVFDKDAKVTRSTYTFNAPFLNQKIDEMRKIGLEPLGFFHSHPPGAKQLSNPDRMYFMSQFKNFPDLDKFIVPLMFPAVDGQYDFIPYIIYKDGRVEKAMLELLPDDYQKFLAQQPLQQLQVISKTNDGRVKTGFKIYQGILWNVFITGCAVFLLALLWLGYQYLSHLLNIELWMLAE